MIQLEADSACLRQGKEYAVWEAGQSVPCSDDLLDVQVREAAYRDEEEACSEEGFAFASIAVVAVAEADAVEVVLAACVDLVSSGGRHSASFAVAEIHYLALDAVVRSAATRDQPDLDQAVARLEVV